MPNSFRAAYAVPVGSGGVILGSGGNVYQVVHQNPRPAAAAAGAAEEEESTTTTTTTQTVQIISGSQLQAINGQIVTRTAQQEREQEQREAEAAVTASESAEASAVTTSQQQSGLTITPVSVAAAAARSQQTVALSGVQPGQIIQVKDSSLQVNSRVRLPVSRAVLLNVVLKLPPDCGLALQLLCCPGIE